MDIFKLLQTLTETPGPSGYEQNIGRAIQEVWKPYTYTQTIDRMGSLIAVKRGSGVEPRPRLLLAAHLDEIALMVTNIESYNGYGFLKFTGVGGIDIRHLYGQRVVVHGQHDLPGVLGCLPGNMLPSDRQNRPFGFLDLVIDVGLTVEEVKTAVSIGDFVSFHQPLRRLMGSLMSGKALDNRASVAAVTVCLEYLQNRHHIWDVLAVATSQEETRLLGAYTAAHAERPDAAIAIDVTFAKGANSNDTGTYELGGGPVLDIGPNVHPGIYQALQDAATALEMKINIGTHTSHSGTDAFGLQIARGGIPTGLVSIPLRYMHTMVETVDSSDIERTGRLLGETIARLDGDFLQKLTDGMMKEGE